MTDSPPLCAFRSDLVRWQQLLEPFWLAQLIAGEVVLAAPAPGWRLLEIGCDAAHLFAQAHIPGASYLDTDQLEHAPFWNKVSDETLLQRLLQQGIRYDTSVLLYSRHPLAAARAAHLLLYAGVRDVRLLDGGFAAWQRAGGATAAGLAPVMPSASEFGCTFPARPDYLIDTGQARQLLQAENGSLVSIRTWHEFIGHRSGYSYIQARGDIAGARWGRAGQNGDVNSMTAFQQADGAMRAAAEICTMWHAAGIDSQQQSAFYCGTGWRASLAFYYAWLMNWQHISVYDGGWYEWSRNPDNPVVRRVARLALATH